MVGVHSCCPGVGGRFVFQGSFDYCFGGFQAGRLGVVSKFCGFVGKFVGEFVPGKVHVAGDPLNVDVAVHGIQPTAQGGNIRAFIVQSGGQRLGVGADQYLVVLCDDVLFQPLDSAIHGLFLFFIGRCEDPSFGFLLVNRDRILRVALGHNHRRPAKVGSFRG